jgi:capsular exopolysaccharide synthesis family protein
MFEYCRIVRRRAVAIAAFLAVGLALSYLFTRQIQPVYEAVATLEVNREAPSRLLGDQTHREAYVPDNDLFMSTQLKMIQLDSVLRPVVQRFGITPRASESGPVGAADGPVELPDLKVTRPPNTQLVQIRYRSTDPQLAAQVSNAIADSFLEQSYRVRVASSASMTAYAGRHLEELKARVERSSYALAQYQKELNLFDADEKTNLVSSRIRQIDSEYLKSQADRFAREAAYHAVQDGNLESAQSSLISAPLRALVERRNATRQKFATSRGHYGPEHPEYRAQAAELAELDRQVDELRQSITKRLEAQYRESVDRERMLAQAFRDAKAEADRLNSKYFTYERLKREADSDTKLYEQILEQTKKADINASFRSEDIRVVDPARPPRRPTSPSLPLNLTIGFLICGVSGVGTAVLSDRADKSVRKTTDVTADFSLTLLGTVPAIPISRRSKEMLPSITGSATLALTPTSAEAWSFTEAIRSIRNVIAVQCRNAGFRSVLVTSAAPGEGKTTVAVQLAIANAGQKKTLLVDADLRRPSVHRFVSVPNERGLVHHIRGEQDWRRSVVPHPTIAGLDILPAGVAVGTCFDGLLQHLGDILNQAASKYEIVIIDGPPSLGCSETLLLGAAADGVVVTIAVGDTERQAVQTMLLNLRTVGANVLGAVLNRMPPENCATVRYSTYYANAEGVQG